MDPHGYEPVARFVECRRARLDGAMSDGSRDVLPDAARDPERPVLVGIAGGVAVGKSTAAEHLAGLLGAGRVEVVGTDGFLLPNAVLEERGLLWRKGFPETYDHEALDGFLRAARRGEAEVPVPVYDHQTYDVMDGVHRRVTASAVLVVEGVNALRYARHLDVAVYLHADEAAMEEWYVARFLELCAFPPPGSFYEHFAGLDVAGRDGVARDVWQSVNLVNLREHIAPTREAANIVVEKAPDHSVVRVFVAEEP